MKQSHVKEDFDHLVFQLALCEHLSRVEQSHIGDVRELLKDEHDLEQKEFIVLIPEDSGRGMGKGVLERGIKLVSRSIFCANDFLDLHSFLILLGELGNDVVEIDWTRLSVNDHVPALIIPEFELLDPVSYRGVGQVLVIEEGEIVFLQSHQFVYVSTIELGVSRYHQDCKVTSLVAAGIAPEN